MYSWKPWSMAVLRVAQADFELRAFGVPNAFIIDQNGAVHIQHLGGTPTYPAGGRLNRHRCPTTSKKLTHR
jgi:hypothetical protein